MISLFSTLPKLQLSRSPDLPGVEINTATYKRELPPFHLLPCVQITLLAAGSTRLSLGREQFVMETGSVMLNGPGGNPRVLERLGRSGVTLRVLISPAVFNAHAGPGADDFEPRVLRRPALFDKVNQLQALMDASAARLKLQVALNSLIAEIREALVEPDTRFRPAPLRPEIFEARQILRERFAGRVSLATLARAVGLSPFHLLRLFGHQLGAPPHAYQLHLRVSHARGLLDGGALATDVALACGFADQAHFTRTFKRIVGFTPAAFGRMA